MPGKVRIHVDAMGHWVTTHSGCVLASVKSPPASTQSSRRVSTRTSGSCDGSPPAFTTEGTSDSTTSESDSPLSSHRQRHGKK